MFDKNKWQKKYNSGEVEGKWAKSWCDSKIYKWIKDQPRENTFVVDTPPPTVSGSLHIGHVYSYTQTDIQVRYQRMRGMNIYYPMGWDDNGLPTERRVQNYFNIKCSPQLPYDPNWKPDPKNKKTLQVSRQNFIEACAIVTKEDEKVFENLWKKLGLSVDWEETYSTVDKHCQKISQLSFLDLIEKGKIYNTKAVTMWDVDFKTAVAQAEVEDREVNGFFHDIVFGIEGEDLEFVISTTRPELLPACIAVAAHPSDERYKKYFGKRAITPLFKAPIPIVASTHADPEKGSGILMICTFGDVADVSWWKESNLPVKQIIGENGTLIDIEFGKAPFDSLDPQSANSAYEKIKGLRVKKAKSVIVELLKENRSSVSGNGPALKGELKPITHPVRFYEKGENPLEFLTTRQWFVNILDFKNELLEQGRKINWYPSYMLARFENWVEGLNQDWCISRQRYFGVPLPVWYNLDRNGVVNYDKPIFPDKNDLPVDPQSSAPKGFNGDERGLPNGFIGDPDIMDTWGTSSLTPQISSFWGVNNDRHKKLFPADLRPQAHDIIRTWAFYTITKAWMHEKEIPWKHATISGFILDPDRKKMSKSKGNAVTPEKILDENSSDVIRYWAGKGRLGVDAAFDETQFKIGRKLITKIFNASKFVLMQIDGAQKGEEYFSIININEEFDRSWIKFMKTTIKGATEAFDKLDYTLSLQIIEESFWSFCDNYLEMVKVVAYQGGESERRRSALASLNWTLNTFLRLFAPFIPFVTEEIWSNSFSDKSPSIHLSKWPSENETLEVKKPEFQNSFKLATEVLSKINSIKTENQKSLKTEVKILKITGSQKDHEALNLVLGYISDAGNVKNIEIINNSNDSSTINIDLELEV